MAWITQRSLSLSINLGLSLSLILDFSLLLHMLPQNSFSFSQLQMLRDCKEPSFFLATTTKSVVDVAGNQPEPARCRTRLECLMKPTTTLFCSTVTSPPPSFFPCTQQQQELASEQLLSLHIFVSTSTSGGTSGGLAAFIVCHRCGKREGRSSLAHSISFIQQQKLSLIHI